MSHFHNPTWPSIFAAFGTLCLAVCGLSAGATEVSPSPSEIVVPQKWESVAASTPEATELAARCMGMPEGELKRMVSDAGNNAIITRTAPERKKSYVVVHSARVICVHKSNNGFPILPLDAFQSTIEFDGMTAEQVTTYRTSLSRQLATRGTAVALIKREHGDATLVNYLFASDPATKMHYQSFFLKKGEFDETKFEAVFDWMISGNMRVLSRGQPSERYKFITSEK